MYTQIAPHLDVRLEHHVRTVERAPEPSSPSDPQTPQPFSPKALEP